jgi:hypothetical protein
MAIADHLEIPIKCPKCSRVLKQTLTRLERDSSIRCSCGSVLVVDGVHELARKMREIEKTFLHATEKGGG